MDADKRLEDEKRERRFRDQREYATCRLNDLRSQREGWQQARAWLLAQAGEQFAQHKDEVAKMLRLWATAMDEFPKEQELKEALHEAARAERRHIRAVRLLESDVEWTEPEEGE
jgi:hypothetical protein